MSIRPTQNGIEHATYGNIGYQNRVELDEDVSLGEDWIDSIFLLEYDDIESREQLDEKKEEWASNFPETDSFEDIWNYVDGGRHEPENYRLTDFEDGEPLNCVGRAITAEIYREMNGLEPFDVLVQYITEEDEGEEQIDSAHVSLTENGYVYDGDISSDAEKNLLGPESLLPLYLVSDIEESLRYGGVSDGNNLESKYDLLEETRPDSSYFEKKADELETEIESL